MKVLFNERWQLMARFYHGAIYQTSKFTRWLAHDCWKPACFPLDRN